MKLYPLGIQRSLEDNFDEADYSGPDGSRKGLLKKYFEDNRRYNGLYSEIEGDTVTLYFYSYSSELPILDISVYESYGYNKSKLLINMESPLFLHKTVYEFNGSGKFAKIHQEEELLTGSVARKLIKDYLDPFLYKKPPKIEYVEEEFVEFDEFKHSV